MKTLKLLPFIKSQFIARHFLSEKYSAATLGIIFLFRLIYGTGEVRLFRLPLPRRGETSFLLSALVGFGVSLSKS
jgi:hypothetical protein